MCFTDIEILQKSGVFQHISALDQGWGLTWGLKWEVKSNSQDGTRRMKP